MCSLMLVERLSLIMGKKSGKLALEDSLNNSNTASQQEIISKSKVGEMPSYS